MGLDPSFWSGRRVLLTGHTGFKGAWFSLWLGALGADVWGYALPPETEPSLFELCDLAHTMKSEFGDVRNREAFAAFIRRCAPSIVIHLAGQPLVRRAYADPVGTFETNVMGTVNVLDALRTQRSLDAVVVVTSDKCYLNRERSGRMIESDRLGGDDPYSASKACAELVTTAFRESFLRAQKVPVATARAGNVIGGGDWSPERIIPDTIAAVIRDQNVVLRHPEAIRPWQHVLEALHGYAVLAQSLALGITAASEWNFGPTDDADVSVADLVEACLSNWGGTSSRWVRSSAEHPAEQSYLRLDSSRAARELGVRTVLSFEQACNWTVQWYREWHEGSEPRRLCLRQIERYQALL